jgi:tetratricopeptide (TPR) repeat protein
MQMPARLLLVAAIVLVATAPAHAVSLKQAQALLVSGDYNKAQAAFKTLTRSAGAQAQLGLARTFLETGRYAEAIKAARRGAKGKRWAAGMTLVGEAQRLLGQLTAAEATLKRVIKRLPRHYRARAYLGLVQHEQGKRDVAKASFDLFYDDHAADKISKSNAAQLTYLAMACRYTDNFQDAHDMLREAVKADPKHVEAYLELAEISLEKYEVGHAEQHNIKVLKINPHLARALTGQAEVLLAQSNDVKGAQKLLDRADKSCPGCAPSLIIRAQILVDAEESAKGEALLQRVLKQRPNDLEALTMLATSRFLRDDLKGFRALQTRVLKLNPRYTQFFRTVVKLGVRHHRYQEAIGLSKQAIKIDPQDWYSLADLGTNYLRMGDDKNGLKYLREAWKGDRYNVRNFNLLNLFEDNVLKEYTFVKTKHFKLRVHKTEAKLLKRTVAPLLEQAYGIYAKKYKFTPKLPIIIELFKDPQHYAVRTVGTPNLSALGVCFGGVITTTSPALGRFNWGQVLWHELNHVFTIQMSRSRVPRWFTEGMADLEPILHRPEWKRENDFDIYKAIRSGRLKGIASMSTAFSRARSIQEMVVAYYQGSLMISYMIKNFTLPKVLQALRAYGKGQRTEQILPAITGVSLKQLDQGFRGAELARLAHYNRNWFVDLVRYEDFKVFAAAAKKKPNDVKAQAELAAALLVDAKFKQASKQAELALGLGAKNRLALYVAARAAQVGRDRGRAEKLFKRLLGTGGDGYDVRVALGRLAIERRDLKTADRHLQAAKSLDPERGLPYVLLSRAYEKKGSTDKLIKELKGLSRLDQQNPGFVGKLVLLLAKRKDYRGVRRYGEMAYYINPASVKLHTYLADAYAAPAPRPRLDKAIWHLGTALLSNPAKPAELHVKLARIHLQRRDPRRARAALTRALKLDPGHAGAKALKSKL